MSGKIVSEGCFNYIVEDGTARICSYSGLEKLLTIPKTLGGYAVVCIRRESFFDCKRLIEVIIPDSITSINDMAFWSCENLTRVEIPNSVTSIGKKVFAKCPSLIEITLSEDHPIYSFFEGILFDKAKGMLHSYVDRHDVSSYIIPDFIMSIGDNAFSMCTNLTEVTVPCSVTRIAYEAFMNCDSLTRIEIPDSVTSIGEWAFDSCKSLASVTFGNSVTSIGRGAFCECKGLKEVRLPKSLTSIGERAFDKGCVVRGNSGK